METLERAEDRRAIHAGKTGRNIEGVDIPHGLAADGNVGRAQGIEQKN